MSTEKRRVVDGEAAADRASSEPWETRWQKLLDAAGPSAARRVQRGQALARRGAVERLDLQIGRVSAWVAEDRTSPYRAEITWPTAPDAAWDRAADELRSELRFTASLLDGELPDELAAALQAVGIDLVPAFDALELRCTCPERVRVCQHVAAAHAAAGIMVGRDPVVLLRLAGRGGEELLREVRRGEDGDAAFVHERIDLSRGLDAVHGDLDAVDLRPAPVEDPAALFRHLGDPPGVDDPEPFVRLISRAAAGAWRLASGDGAEAADEELLLAELRAKRVASAASLAEALGRDQASVTEHLDRLFEAGTVMRTGSGTGARYRAGAS